MRRIHNIQVLQRVAVPSIRGYPRQLHCVRDGIWRLYLWVSVCAPLPNFSHYADGLRRSQSDVAYSYMNVTDVTVYICILCSCLRF